MSWKLFAQAVGLVPTRISRRIDGKVRPLLRRVAVIPIGLMALAIAAPARAADPGQEFVIRHATQGATIDLGAGRTIDAWITTCPTAWRVGDRLRLEFSERNGATVIDLRSGNRASVIGLTDVENPINAALKRCLSQGRNTDIRDEGCYETAAAGWRSQVHAMLKLGQAVLPKTIMDNFRQNHATPKGVDIASLTATQQQFSQAVENFVTLGEAVNSNLSIVTGAELSVSQNAAAATFLARVNELLWAQLRQGANDIGLPDTSCQPPR